MSNFLGSTMKHYKGFSLVELLVVVSIIGVLSTIGLTSYQGIALKTKDVQKKAGVDALAKVFETKHNLTTGIYPSPPSIATTDFASGKIPDGTIFLSEDQKSFKACLNLQNPASTPSCNTDPPPADCYCRASVFGTPPTPTPIAQSSPDIILPSQPPAGSPSPSPTVPAISSPSPASPPIVSTCPSTGLISYWNMDETSGANIADSSGSNNGTAYGTTTVDGKFTKARSFNGTSDYINLQNPQALNLSAGTISVWVKTSGAGSNYRAIIAKNYAYGLYLKGNILETYDENAGADRPTNVNIADSTWHHLVLTFQSGVTNGTTIYVDGDSKLTTTITIGNQNYPLLLGNNSGASQFFNGTIDDLKIFNRVLNSTEAGELFTCNSTSSPSPTASPTTPGGEGTDSLAGIYVFYDWSNLSPVTYPWIKGGDIDPRWNELETSEGNFNWTNLENDINNMRNIGKAVFVKVDPHSRTETGIPDYVYAAGVPKIQVGSIYYPKWWNSTFIQKYKNFIARFGQKYNGDSRLAGIGVSIGEYGEAMPGTGGLSRNGSNSYLNFWNNAGLTATIWADYGKQIIDAYAAAFPDTPLFMQLQHFYPENVSTFADYAASKGINMGFNGLSWDNSNTSYWDPPFDKYSVPGTLAARLEWGAGSTSDTVVERAHVYWSILNALRKHASMISLYANQLKDTDNEAIFAFGNKYAGKKITDTPGAWIAFKEWQGNSYVWDGHQGNYEFWISQYDPGGTTIPLFGVDNTQPGLYARRTDIASGKSTFYLKVDDGYIYPGPSARFNSTSGKQVKINVTYFDNNSASFAIKYDSTSGSKTAATITKAGSNTWKTYSVTVSDAYFGNRLTNGADILITASGGDTTLHMAEVEGGEVAGISTIFKQINLQHIIQQIISFLTSKLK